MTIAFPHRLKQLLNWGWTET